MLFWEFAKRYWIITNFIHENLLALSLSFFVIITVLYSLRHTNSSRNFQNTESPAKSISVNEGVNNMNPFNSRHKKEEISKDKRPGLRDVKKFIYIFLGIICLFLLFQFSRCVFGYTEKWKEEVQLSNGHIIIIKRERLISPHGGEWPQKGWGRSPKEDHMRFVIPEVSSKTIKWKTMKKESMGYPEIPLILDIKSGEPVIFTLVGVSPGCEIYNKYVYHNGIWSEEALPEEFKPLMSNLYVGTSQDLPKLVGLYMKRKIIESGHSRRAVKQVGPTRKICG